MRYQTNNEENSYWSRARKKRLVLAKNKDAENLRDALLEHYPKLKDAGGIWVDAFIIKNSIGNDSYSKLWVYDSLFVRWEWTWLRNMLHKTIARTTVRGCRRQKWGTLISYLNSNVSTDFSFTILIHKIHIKCHRSIEVKDVDASWKLKNVFILFLKF